jgi:hypothetical protein
MGIKGYSLFAQLQMPMRSLSTKSGARETNRAADRIFRRTAKITGRAEERLWEMLNVRPLDQPGRAEGLPRYVKGGCALVSSSADKLLTTIVRVVSL